MYTCHIHYVFRLEPPIEPMRTSHMSVPESQEATDHSLRTVILLYYIEVSKLSVLTLFVAYTHFCIHKDSILYLLKVLSYEKLVFSKYIKHFKHYLILEKYKDFILLNFINFDTFTTGKKLSIFK